MSELLQIVLAGFVVISAHGLGYVAGRGRRLSTAGFSDKWPTCHIQFDPSMSQEEMLHFLASAEAMVKARALGQADKLCDDAASDESQQPHA